MADALDRWAARMPDGTATIQRGDGMVSFKSCDPGPDANLAVTGRSGDALAYPAVRTDIVTARMANGDESDVALCFGTRVVTQLTPAQLTEDAAFFDSLEFRDLVLEAQNRCR
jgi:hypothetical protein